MQRDLVIRAREGDVDAFAELTLDLTTRLYATARLILRDHEHAADVVQDALLRAWLDLRGLRDPDRFEAWLNRLLVHACYRAAARQRHREVAVLRLDPGAEPEMADAQYAVAVRDQLERGFRRLSAEQRAVIVLRHYQGLSLAGCAEVLGVPLGTVQSRLNRATRTLRAALDADERPAMAAAEVVR